ncbi:MAG: hypothetical protein K5773_03410 [Pseudobutyrivibrio sp.]|nr:hypothetical protein [Pseudobutyrivibrio sp.]
MNLLFSSAITVFFVIFFYKKERNYTFSKHSYLMHQELIGVAFGFCSILSIEYCTITKDAIISTRDAAPVVAGLVFGGPSGIIAGIISGTYRLLWHSSISQAGLVSSMLDANSMGGFARIAGALGSIFAGLIAALAKKYLVDEKKANVFLALFISSLVLIFELTMVFYFRSGYSIRTNEVLAQCAVPIYIANIVTVGIAMLAAWALSVKKAPVANKTQEKFDLSWY